MSTVKFNGPAPAAEEVLEDNAQVGETQLAEQGGDQALTQSVEQESTDIRYIKFPKLQIIAKTGKLSDAFPKNVGEWLYDESDVWGDESLRVVVLGAPHWLEENLDFDSSDLPVRFRNLEEATRAGYTHADDGPGERTVIDVAQLYLLIAHEDGDMLDDEDQAWTLGTITVRKGGFKDTWVKWNTQRSTGRLKDSRGGTIAGAWDLAIVSKNYAGNSWYSPVLRKPKGKESTTSDKFREWALEQFGKIIRA